jgi:protein-tyrosine phosphatase
MEHMDSAVLQECKILNMENKNKEIRILFVCMGNICRSPAGEGILRAMVNQDPSLKIYVESCGIGDWHLGQAADKRMQEAAKERGIVLTTKAKQLQHAFFEQFDYILAADNEVLKYLYHYAKSPEQKAKIFLMTAFSSLYKGQEVPDPYYQPNGAFGLVLDILEDSCRGLLEYIRQSSNKA